MFRTYIIRMIRSTAIIYQVKQGIQLQKRYISSCFIGNYIYIATIEVTLFIQPRRVSFSKGSPLIIDRITFSPGHSKIEDDVRYIILRQKKV